MVLPPCRTAQSARRASRVRSAAPRYRRRTATPRARVRVPSGGSDLEQFALGIVDLRLVLVTPDAPALQATNRYLKWISEIDSPTKLVINQQSQGAAVAPAEIKNHLGNSLVGVLPIDPQGVWANVSYGKPCSLCKTSKLGAAIRRLSERLLKMINRQP